MQGTTLELLLINWKESTARCGTLQVVLLRQKEKIFRLSTNKQTSILDRPLKVKQSEFDYSVQEISILLRFVLNAKSKVDIVWEEPSITNQNTNGKTVTHGHLIYSNYQELGCGEVKVAGADERLQEEDRARLGERSKKQLHQNANQSRDFYVFDNIMELYRSSFSREDGYNDLVLLCQIMLPI